MADDLDKEFSGLPQFSRFYDSSTGERVPLNVVLENHLMNCQRCQEMIPKKPSGLGQISKFCFEYQDIIQDWAQLESRLNNIVAHDEFGNQAPTSADPARYPPQWP